MEFSAEQIALFIGGTVVGDGSVKVNTFAKIEEGHEGALSFIDNPKYEKYLYTTDSSILIVNNDLAVNGQKTPTLIKVEDARQGFTLLMQKLTESSLAGLTGISKDASIAEGAKIFDGVYVGEQAVIKGTATVGSGSKIFPQVFLGNNVQIGENCVLYPGVKILRDCILGNNCTIHSGTIIGSDGFGFAPNEKGELTKVPQIGNVIIGNNVELGSNCSVDRATMGSTIIKDGAKLDNLIQVAHNVVIGENTVIAAQTGISGTTKIGAGCQIGGQVGVAGHIEIADGSKINAQSGIGKSLDEKGKAWSGTPAREFRQHYKTLAYLNRLPELQAELKALKQEIADLKAK